MKAVLVFGASGPLLILSSYPTLDHPEMIMKLQAKGIDKFMAWEVPLDHCGDLYGYTCRDAVEELGLREDIYVLDSDGHHIFLNFSLSDRGEGIVYDGGRVSSLS
jgi:hypothetical protein